MEIFLQQIINGLTLGSVYAIVALGYTMVYGIIQLINFAHGEVVMIGAMIALTVIGTLAGADTGLAPVLIVLAGAACAIPVCMGVGYAMERVAYRPLRGAPRLAPLITAIGISIILQNIALDDLEPRADFVSAGRGQSVVRGGWRAHQRGADRDHSDIHRNDGRPHRAGVPHPAGNRDACHLGKSARSPA